MVLYFIGLCVCFGTSIAAGRAVGEYFHSWPVGLVMFLIAAYVLIRTYAVLASVFIDVDPAWGTSHRRYGSYTTDSDREATLDALAARTRAKNDALSRGVSPEKFDEDQRLQRQADRQRSEQEALDRLRKAAEGKPLNWGD
jgi:hypothetical protein